MKDEKPDDKKGQQTAGMQIPAGMGQHYADIATVNMGYNGFKLTFGSVYPVDFGEEQQKLIQVSAMIGMSPEHAQSLHEVLGRSLESYKDLYGPIRPKPDTVEPQQYLAKVPPE
jgi:virulence-associated protein VapD